MIFRTTLVVTSMGWMITACSSGTEATCPESCDDGVFCTVDICDDGTKECTHIPDDRRCTTGNCDADRGCVCTQDTDCQEGEFCNADGFCQAVGDCSGKCCGPDGAGGECQDNCTAEGKSCDTDTCLCVEPDPCVVSPTLINPCNEDIIGDPGCGFLRVVVSAQDPSDPLHCLRSPLAMTCEVGGAACEMSCASLAGQAREMHVTCHPALDQPAVATSVSSPFDVAADGPTIRPHLLAGAVNEFAHATVIEPGDDVGTCSQLGDEGGRFGHTATVLDDGRVLIAGGIRRLGQGDEEILASAEIYDPVTGRHAPVSTQATAARAFHTATLLRNGKILLAGGIGLVQDEKTALQSAELFDPASMEFGEPSTMGSARAHHTATTLATGQVLLAGGAMYAGGVVDAYHDTAAVYDASTNTFLPVANTMASARAFHAAVLLDPRLSGSKALLVGGENSKGPLDSVDIFDPDTGTFFADVDVVMSTARTHVCAGLLDNGDVLVAGGSASPDVTGVDAGVEIYSPAGGVYGAFEPQTLSLGVARMDHTCTVLASGNVLVAGGLAVNGRATGAGELVLMDGEALSVKQLSDSMVPARYLHAASLLRGGQVLLTGGLPFQDVNALAATQSVLFVPEPEECGP